jgi:hypothetical protein
LVPGRVDPDVDGEFRLCVDVPRKCDEWVVDCRFYNLDMLLRDLEARVKWGSGQQPMIHEFDRSGGGEKKLVDDKDLSLAFAEKMHDKKLFLFVDFVDKPAEMFSNSVVTEAEAATSNVGHDNATEQGDCSNPALVSHQIDWESLLITPLTEDQIGIALPVMDEDAMYEFVGLRAEDERAEQARIVVQKVTEINLDDMELQDADLLVHDHIPGEDSVFYDKEDPSMKVGTIYSSMNEFRAAMRQHAIKGQFQLATKKSRTDYFSGKCNHESCSLTISARLIRDDQQVRVLTLFICHTLTLFIYICMVVLSLFICSPLTDMFVLI